MWAHAEGAPELLTGEQLDTLEPRDLEYRCPLSALHAAVSTMVLVFPAAWASFSCLPCLTFPQIELASWGLLLHLESISTWR